MFQTLFNLKYNYNYKQQLHQIRNNFVPFDPSAKCIALSFRGLDTPASHPGQDSPRCTAAFPQTAESHDKLQAITGTNKISCVAVSRAQTIIKKCIRL